MLSNFQVFRKLRDISELVPGNTFVSVGGDQYLGTLTQVLDAYDSAEAHEPFKVEFCTNDDGIKVYCYVNAISFAYIYKSYKQKSSTQCIARIKLHLDVYNVDFV